MTTKKQARQPKDPDAPAEKAGDIAKRKTDKLKKDSVPTINCSKCNRAFKKKDSLEKHEADCTGGNGINGGARPGAGRKPGSENEKTKELKAIKAGMQMQIAGKVNQLIAHQFRMAMGTSRLYMRYEEEYEIGKGKNKTKQKRYQVLPVTNEADFMLYLSLSHDEHGRAKDKDTNTEYFYMTDNKGNPMALANLLDRAFGKPKESMEVSDDPDAPMGKAGTGTTSEIRKLVLATIRQQVKQPREASK